MTRRAAATSLLTAILAVVFRGRPHDLVAETPATEFDEQRAFDYLVKICRLGSRMSGSRGMAEQQKILVEHFTAFDAEVRFQPFDAAHPLNGQPVRMNNLIVSWHPQSQQRVLLACHYDTRPYPDRDLILPRGKFIGANDGASGVALFMELAHHLQGQNFPYGIDMVLFDGEELIYGRQGKYFLGSEYFATNYRDEPPAHKYLAGVLVDMIADRNLDLFQEKNSLKYAPLVTKSIWETATRLKVKEFINRAKHEVQDDHLPLNEIAQIPTCDIIDFDYRFWHTTKDIPAQCSGRSLATVGKVLLAWLANPPDLSR
ncbi:MAG: M28 family peptidase [Planctomycetota bacterium]|nr:M28 family peptidase [Planctomycetota bacterium]MDA1212432.1 M28 family peptidase [Planctomycetota bacterium]